IQADLGQAGPPEGGEEGTAAQVGNPQVAAAGVAEDGAAGVALGQHALAVLVQGRQGERGQVDAPPALLRLHVLDAHAAGNLCQGFRYGDDATLEIDISPQQGEQLARTHATVQGGDV